VVSTIFPVAWPEIDRVDPLGGDAECEGQVDRAVTDGVEHGGEAFRRGGADVVGETVAVGEGFDPETAQQSVVARTGRGMGRCSISSTSGPPNRRNTTRRDAVSAGSEIMRPA
jgi:hypothetical protein